MSPHESSSSVTVHTTPERAWSALTDPAQVKQYFFGTNLVTDWKPGSPVLFKGEWEGKPYEDRGTVLGFEPPRRLSFNYWSNFSGTPDVAEQRQIIAYEVQPEGGGVRVTIKQSNCASQQAADDSAKNWSVVLGGLKKLLESA